MSGRQIVITVTYEVPDDYEGDWRYDLDIEALFQSIPEQHPIFGDSFVVGHIESIPAGTTDHEQQETT